MRFAWLKTVAVFLLAAFALNGCNQTSDAPERRSSPVHASAGSDPALAMVERTGLGNGLTKLAVTAAQKTETYGQLTAKLGPAAFVLLRSEVSALLPKYQSQWNRNLADCYAAHLVPEEMKSIALEGKNSPSAGKLLSVQADVSVQMRAKSSQLLRDLVSEALTNAVKKSGLPF